MYFKRYVFNIYMEINKYYCFIFIVYDLSQYAFKFFFNKVMNFFFRNKLFEK